MTKGKIISIVAEGTGLTKMETAAVIDGFLATMIYSLTQGESVQIRELGTFRAVKRKSRTARNPRTGGIVLIPSQIVAKFRPAKSLRNALNRSQSPEPAEIRITTETES
jgi:nucleoid DNA-binding protein